MDTASNRATAQPVMGFCDCRSGKAAAVQAKAIPDRDGVSESKCNPLGIFVSL